MKLLYSLLITLLFTSCISVKADINSTAEESTDYELAEAGIRLVLEKQVTAWNKHDLEGFMDGYWKSDQLKFYGASGLTLGWDQTLANYKKRYPTKREIGDAEGVFIIIFKQINGEWKIVADMSC